MLTPQESSWLYQVLDEVNVRGEENKIMMGLIMRKLRKTAQPLLTTSPEPKKKVPPKSKKKRAKKR